MAPRPSDGGHLQQPRQAAEVASRCVSCLALLLRTESPATVGRLLKMLQASAVPKTQQLPEELEEYWQLLYHFLAA